MRSISYITNDCWWDTDNSIMPDLCHKYNVEIFCLSHRDFSKNKYPQKDVPYNCILHNFNILKSFRDMKTAILSVCVGIYISYKTRGKLKIWVVDYNFYNILLLLSFFSKKNTIVSFHNYKEHIGAPRWLLLSQKLILKKFQYYHLYSENQANLFIKDYPNARIFTTKMKFKDYGSVITQPPFFQNNNRTFLFFGTIREYKRLDIFIKAANMIGTKANFIIAGNCKNWDKYRKMITNFDTIVSHIKFVNNEDIPSYFLNSDFIVLPYDDSTQSGPLLIAFNYNLPILASSLPFFSSMIDDKISGIIFEKGSVSSLVSSIEYAIHMSDVDYSKMKDMMSIKGNNYLNNSSYSSCLIKFVDANNL